jgi:hypothetical protein
MKIVNRLFLFLLLLLLAGMPACGLNQILRQGTPVPRPPVEAKVTADQIAQAMQNDEFYSQYRGNMLLVTGKIHTVNQNGNDTQLELETSLPTKTICDLGTQTALPNPGDQVTVQALAAEAERAPSAVLLKNCRIH